MAKTTTKRTKKKAKRKVPKGVAHIHSSYNNTLVSITDPEGNLIGQSSAGHAGFSGARKATPYAAQKIVADVLEKTAMYGLEEVKVFVRGIGSAREAAIRALSGGGINVTAIRDVTPIPHNGVRPPKRRRV